MDRNALYPVMPEGSGPEFNALYMPTQFASSYTPTLRDRLAQWWLGDERPSPEMSRLVEGFTGSRGMGTTGFGIGEALPVVGQVGAVQDAWRGGDDRALAMALMPGPKGRAPAKPATNEAIAEALQPQGIRAYHGGPKDLEGGRLDMKYADSQGVLYATTSRDLAQDYVNASWKAVHELDLQPGPLGVLRPSDGIDTPAGKVLLGLGADANSATVGDAIKSLRAKKIDGEVYNKALADNGYRVYQHGSDIYHILSDQAVSSVPNSGIRAYHGSPPTNALYSEQ